MTPEQKVTSRELSEKLKEAGAYQRSENVWAENLVGRPMLIKTPPHPDVVSAFDCAELLEMLPKPQTDKGPWVTLFSDKDVGWIATHEKGFDFDPRHSTASRTPVEALGKLYLWCLENGYTEKMVVLGIDKAI